MEGDLSSVPGTVANPWTKVDNCRHLFANEHYDLSAFKFTRQDLVY